MINRRSFNINVTLGGGLALLVRPASAQPIKTLKQGNGSGSNDASQSFITCGRHSRLRYFEVEGLDVELIAMRNLAQTMTSVASGQVTYGGVTPGLYLPALGKEPNFPVIAAYNFLPRNANVVVVKPDSPIKTVADLRGKRVGIRNQGDQSLYAPKMMLRELGLDDTKVEYIAVGDGGQAGIALTENRVDAVASFDVAAARIEREMGRMLNGQPQI